MKRLDDRIQLQMDAAERRQLLELGKIEVTAPPDTSTFTRQVQLEASSPTPGERHKG